MKKADNQEWQKLFDELATHIQKDPKLSKIIRTKDNGNTISIGEPNWQGKAIMAAFSIGWSIGTACYKSGLCDYTKYVS